MPWSLSFVVLVGILVVGSNAASPPLSSPSKSPLDSATKTNNEIPSIWEVGMSEDVQNLPDCLSACAEFLMPLLNNILQNGSNKQRIAGSCREFDSAEKCMATLTHCPRNELYMALTSGLRYMCVEQREAFEANVECMDKVHDQVSSGCDAQCHPQTLVQGFAVKDAFTKGFAEGLDMGIVKKFIDPHLSKIFFSESCRIGQCLLQCFRNKFNIHCDGSAGSLLSEAIVRPFGSQQLNGLPVGAVLGAFMPNQCRFLYDEKSMKKFRIDPQLDQDLKKRYREGAKKKVITTEERVAEAINSLQYSGGNPFENTDTMKLESPIDTGYRSHSRARRNQMDEQKGPHTKFGEQMHSASVIPPIPKHTNNPSSVFDDDLLEVDWLEDEEETTKDSDVHPAKKDTKRGKTVPDEEYESGSADDLWNSGLPEPTWQTVEDVSTDGMGEMHRIEMGVQPGADGVTALKLERTVDNADLYLAQWIQPQRTYRVDVNVQPEDEGEFVCLLRTFKGFAVNKLTDEDIESLVNDLEKLKKR